MSYNGWRNHATWNIALHIGNNESWYEAALRSIDFNDFQKLIGRLDTDDGIKLADGDYHELTECILEMQESG